jgi:hypothetical protein
MKEAGAHLLGYRRAPAQGMRCYEKRRRGLGPSSWVRRLRPEPPQMCCT